MKTWRIYTPNSCRVVIEQNPGTSHRMVQFDGLTEEEVVEVVTGNIMRSWSDAEIKRTTYWNHPALDVSLDGHHHHNESPEEPPELYYVAQGY